MARRKSFYKKYGIRNKFKSENEKKVFIKRAISSYFDKKSKKKKEVGKE